MDIYELSDITQVDIVWRRYSKQGNRHIVNLERAEVKEGSCLAGYYGDGTTPSAALEDYVSRIKGKTLVFNAMDKEKRREFGVPSTLTTRVVIDGPQ